MMKDGLFADLQQWSESWVQVQQAFHAWSHEYDGWIIALGVVGLVAVFMLGVRGLLARARALPQTDTGYPQRSTIWKGVPRVPGPSTQYGWSELLALVVGAVMCAVVVGLVTRYGSSFPHLPLIFPIPPLQ